MNSMKFWVWRDTAEKEADTGRVLELNGTIAEESWFDDDITPEQFKEELFAGSGPITVWINSPGGDCIAASQIYAMLMDYPSDVIVKIDGIAASAASVIAMAGTEVRMAPTAMMMIHNPATLAYGDHTDMAKAIEMLEEVKESIINAYEIKTGLSRARLSHLMDAETWMNVKKAIELGFADGMLEDVKKTSATDASYTFSSKAVANALFNKLAGKTTPVPVEPDVEPDKPAGRSVEELKARLNIIKKYI